MVKPKNKNSKREIKVPVWFIDGFVGILALVIYNFLLYFLTALKVGGIIAKIEEAMGYFGLNTFTDLGMSSSSMTLGLIVIIGAFYNMFTGANGFNIIQFLVGVVLIVSGALLFKHSRLSSEERNVVSEGIKNYKR